MEISHKSIFFSKRAPLATSNDFSEISVPTMVITGDADTLVGQPDILAAKIPGGRFTVISGDHLSAVSDPRFASSIVAFFDESGI